MRTTIMSTFRAPSTTLLRAFFKPSPCVSCQVRTLVDGFMPRHKYAKPNRLDKLHRKQKQAIRAERQATVDRASSMILPSLSVPVQTTKLADDLPFTISRTTQRNIPVYETTKAGGSKHITQIRRLSGDLDALAADLRTALNLPDSYVDQKGRKKECVVVNRLTQQIVIRGWRGAEVKKWVEGLGF